MAYSRIDLSGAAKRKQRQIRNQNEAKSRRTLEDLNWYTKIQRNNKSQSEGVEVSSDEVVCADVLQIWMILHTLLLIWMREWLVKKLK